MNLYIELEKQSQGDLPRRCLREKNTKFREEKSFLETSVHIQLINCRLVEEGGRARLISINIYCSLNYTAVMSVQINKTVKMLLL